MPKSTDNQDYTDNTPNENEKNKGATKSSDNEDENNFTSDDQKGKKIDADPTQESEQPAKQS